MTGAIVGPAAEFVKDYLRRMATRGRQA